MTLAAEYSALVAPLLASWDETTVPIAWEGEDFDPPAKTADRTNPARFIGFQSEETVRSYFTFTGDEIRGVLPFDVYVEPIAGIGGYWHRSIMDSLRTTYTGQDTTTLFFRLGEARPTTPIITEEVQGQAWRRQEWTLPFWRYE